MTILTRLKNRVFPRQLERDLKDEVEFHIDMRAGRHLKDGMPADEAAGTARRQFGDVKKVTGQMRRERMSSAIALVAVTAFSVCVALLVVVAQLIGTADLRIPKPPEPPVIRDIDRPSGSPPPPPPGRGPTWEEYKSQANAFKALQRGPGTYSPAKPSMAR